MSLADEQRQLDAIRMTYPGWAIDVTDGADGRRQWTAVRHGPTSETQRDAGLVDRLDTATAAELLVRLGRQDLIVHQGRGRERPAGAAIP